MNITELNGEAVERVTTETMHRAPPQPKKGRATTVVAPAPQPQVVAAPAVVPAPVATGNSFFDASSVDGTSEPEPIAYTPSPMVLKMRAKLGMTADKLERVPVYIGDDMEPSFTFGLRPLSPEDYRWVTRQVVLMQEAGDMALTTRVNVDLASVAMSIASLDDGGKTDDEPLTPIHEALCIEPESAAHVRNPFYPHVTLRKRCATIVLHELVTEWNEFSEALINAYNARVGTKTRISTSAPKPEEAAETTANPTTPAG